MSDSTSGKMARYLRDHPRMMGVLFTLAVLLTQATPVAANCSGSVCGG